VREARHGARAVLTAFAFLEIVVSNGARAEMPLRDVLAYNRDQERTKGRIFPLFESFIGQAPRYVVDGLLIFDFIKKDLDVGSREAGHLCH
jgi:hypothetical protein